MEITLEQLVSITSQKESILLPFIDPLNKILQNVQFSNLNLSHFISQICHESGCFKFTEEIASGIAYEGRTDLGNTQPNFGQLFKGRGILQITGFFNYQKLSDYFKTDFVSQPTLLKTPEWAVKSAKWYWDTKNLNQLAEQNNFLMITYKINGGFNGLQERLKYLKLCFKTFEVPNFDVCIKDIFTKIDQNLLLPSTNHFKTSLLKFVPDSTSLINLKNFINLL